jgi:hypothetical protein
MLRNKINNLNGDFFGKDMVGWLGPILSMIYGFWNFNILVLQGTSHI